MDQTMIVNIEEGLIILLVGMGIVFLSLLLLHLIFEYAIPPLLSFSWKTVVSKVAPAAAGNKVPDKKYDSGEEIAAITAAINLFMDEIHDEENPIMTISKSVKDYSPWSSKIYVTHNVLRTTGKR